MVTDKTCEMWIPGSERVIPGLRLARGIMSDRAEGGEELGDIFRGDVSGEV